MRIAIVGCGYVADFYLKTLGNHSDLELVGVMDRDHARAAHFAKFNGVSHVYASFEELLADTRVELVLNLTNPSSHYEISKAALLAGKHVYSEKPLSMDYAEAEELVALAESRGLTIAGAPCSVLGESAQTLWKALREDRIGKVRLVYAELDDGPIHLMDYGNWKSDSGNAWPAKDEFEVGCTLEHAGYYVTWLCAFFGPASRVTSFASVTIPDKGLAVDVVTPDFTVGCIEWASGIVARVTCSIFGTHDHKLRIFGDGGILGIEDCWDYASPVFASKRNKLGLKAEKYPRAARLTPFGPRKIPLARKPTFAFKTRGANPMDFCRGVAEVAASIVEKRACRIGARFALHVNEIVLALQNPKALGSPRTLTSSFVPMRPMPWADCPAR